MSYQVLARKWRPHTFEAMVGQEHVIRALANGLEQERIHHAYLFTGTRGVGKTTMARILAKCLNCEDKGVTRSPCNGCEACRAIDSGRFVDLLEVDAASRTKVEDTRELLDNVQYTPAVGRYKIYLIDEVHMLSGHSFNALLKTLEEPPPHVKFLLATTDPQKLPVTVLSRCLQLNLKRLPSKRIAAHLEYVLNAEAIGFEAAAVARIARAADGSLRDALSVLDQAIAHGAGRVDDDAVRGMLGAVEGDLVVALLERLACRDGAGALECVEQMSEQTPDFAPAVSELLGMLHSLALAQGVTGGLDESVPERERLEALARQLSPEEVQLFYQLALTGRRDLPLAPDPRMGFEMLVLRLLAFRPISPDDPLRQPADDGALMAKSAVAAPPANGAAEPDEHASGNDATASPWPEVVEQLALSGMAKGLAQNCDWVSREGELITLRLEEGHRHLLNAAMQERLEGALIDYFGSRVRLRIDVGAISGETPAAVAARGEADRQRAAEEAIDSDPNVAALCDAFDARVIPESVQPDGGRR